MPVERLCIVELAGPAGAGKSTLAKALSEHDSRIQLAMPPYIRQANNLPLLLSSGYLLLPTYVALAPDRRKRFHLLHQVFTMTILKRWRRELRDRHQVRERIFLLDQGPVHMLADLLRRGPTYSVQDAPTWWKKACQDWAEVLDLVICLDAPDAVLLERVRARDKAHGFKRMTDERTIQFLAKCRLTQEETLLSMSAKSGRPRVASFQSSQTSLAGTTETALMLIQSELGI